MRLAEPMTVATDYALAAVSVVLGARLLREGARRRQRSMAFWGGAFLAAAFAAVVGGSSHGLAPVLAAEVRRALRIATVSAIGGATALLLAGTIVAAVAGRAVAWLHAANAAKLAAYLLWITAHSDFRWAVYDSVVTMFAVVLLLGWAGERSGFVWVVSSFAVSAAGATLQRSAFDPHPAFNHNDLYHVVEMFALVLLYKGGRRLSDSG